MMNIPLSGRLWSSTAAMMLATALLPGAIINISPDVDPATNVANINQALVDAGPGGTVVFAAGSYPINAQITLSQPVTIEGPQADTDPRPVASTTRTPGSAGEAIVDGQSTVGTLFYITASDVTINGMEFRNGTADMIYTPSTGSLSNITVQYCIVINALGDEAIQIRDTANVIVEYNFIKDGAEDGVNICCGGWGTIRYNEFDNVDSENGAIYVYDTQGTTIHIHDNYLHGCGSANGIFLRNTGAGIAVTIEDNLIDGNTWNRSKRAQDNNAINLYKAYESPLDGGTTFVLRNNTITNNTAGVNASQGNAIFYYHDASADTTLSLDVTGNQTAGNSGYGMEVELENIADVAVIAGITASLNTFGNNTLGGLRNAAAGTMLLAENNWWGAANGPSTDGSSTATGSGSTVSTDVDFEPWAYFPGAIAVAVDTSSTPATVDLTGLSGDRYTLHGVTLPTGSLSGPGRLSLQSPTDRHGVDNAVEILLSGASITTGAATITIEYDPATDLVDTSLNPMAETYMRLYKWNDGLTMWERVPGGTVDEVSNTVSGDVTSFSVYAALADPLAGVAEWMLLDE